MPTYSYECKKGHEYEEVLPVADYQKKTFCPKCKGDGKKTITLRASSPSFSDRLYPYFDPNLNKRVENPKHRERVMREMGFVSKEGHRRTTLKQERFLLRHKI